MPLWAKLLLISALTAGNVTLFIASAHQLFDATARLDDARVERRSAQAQHEAADAQRHAAEAQRAVVEALAEHMRLWLEASRQSSVKAP